VHNLSLSFRAPLADCLDPLTFISEKEATEKRMLYMMVLVFVLSGAAADKGDPGR
jgi:hypothetical protein